MTHHTLRMFLGFCPAGVLLFGPFMYIFCSYIRMVVSPFSPALGWSCSSNSLSAFESHGDEVVISLIYRVSIAIGGAIQPWS